jgi:hypothetical protein
MTEETTAPPKIEAPIVQQKPQRAQLIVQDSGSYLNLLDTGRFEHIQRVARVYSASSMIPKHFHGKFEDVFVVAQMAFRMNVDPLMMLQNTYVVSGTPAIKGQMAIALVNSSGALKGRLRFRYEGEGDARSCTAYGVDRDTGEALECRVTMKTAADEGWLKNPKWKSMPDQMLAYRSGAWFARMYAPDALFGLKTLEEAEDMGGEPIDVTPHSAKADELDKLLSNGPANGTAHQPEVVS